MKGRSHRFQSHHHHHEPHPHDDWVDGSWTVDCLCGVNFDDGEEMVNCDECGVWVHTRCSRYVKGEESFTCDKCKAKNHNNYNNNNSSHNYINSNDNSEETEVAQLLVELPTKTIRLENNGSYTGGGRLRLWTDIPMEERVHVQGIPGGDPQLFTSGRLSSVFSPQLWKCTGHVPKKLNFRYREFPGWDVGARNEQENDNMVDKGAGVLFSLSKDTPLLQTPPLPGLGRRNQEGARLHRNVNKVWEEQQEASVNKERSLIRPVFIHSGKKKKEDLGTSRDRSSKKKARTADKEADPRRRSSHTSNTAFTSTSDAQSLEFHEDRTSKSVKSQSTKDTKIKDSVIQEYESDCLIPTENAVEIPKNIIAVIQHSSEDLPSIAGLGIKGDALQVSPYECTLTEEALPKHNDVARVAVKSEGDEVSNSDRFENTKGTVHNDVTRSNDQIISSAREANDNQSIAVDNQTKVKADAADDAAMRLLTCESSPGDAKDIGLLSDKPTQNSEMDDAAVSGSEVSILKPKEVDRTLAVSDCHMDKTNELSCDLSQQLKQDEERSEGSVAVEKSPVQTNYVVGSADEFPKLDGTIFSSPPFPSQCKLALSVGFSHLTSSAAGVSSLSASDNLQSACTPNFNHDTRQQATPDSISAIKKEQAASDVVRDEDRPDLQRLAAKEHPKSSLDSASKASNPNKISHTSTSRRTQSDSKDSVLYSSSKASSASNGCESIQSLQNESSSHVQNKSLTSVLLSKGEKISQSNSHSVSKANHSLSMNPSAPSHSPATLSDEELALLLHQELNSSPRVPRVPRVRHAGSLPHLTSPTATSMLIKRTSSSGGKDHNLVSRRKSKEAFKDEHRRSLEIDAEAKRTGRMPSPTDRRRQDVGYSADGLAKREDYGSPSGPHSVKKNHPPASTSTANSCPSSSTEVNDHHLSYTRNSSRDISDEDAGTVRASVHRTLPSLINEIMSKGRRMTYEELCNAVLPHWHNLRKHNGERYAYSSHSQAVLDCLRNRHEWARLVDRGPKTNPSRKRRKFDPEESEDNDYGKGRSVREGDGDNVEAQREEFPKGKRKARKRRRLALQGRGIKDVRKRQKAELHTDDGSGQFSNSSEETLFSEDEIQDSEAGPIDRWASDSSNEAGTL
ncbi:hypothetical protein Tsubulata_023154 [Turnera subulata]|uniref:Zinc finger PHD-type domain-containing protein n=1 Tax=Turnera subulata TaxID=218843 RepID=A0A9Q0JGY2_9ROSI|nr:hypothetical protein Tsubulata_023154 [Turnera subulata]